eukprot:15330044-Alexandrium_andersonii.AAC.1
MGHRGGSATPSCPSNWNGIGTMTRDTLALCSCHDSCAKLNANPEHAYAHAPDHTTQHHACTAPPCSTPRELPSLAIKHHHQSLVSVGLLHRGPVLPVRAAL